MRPTLGLLLALALLALLAAWYSPAIPLALFGLPAVVLGVVGSNPLPTGAVSGLLAGWVALGLFFCVIRGKSAPPLRVVAAVPVVVSVVLLGWMLLRVGDSPAGDYATQKIELFLAGNLVFLVGGVFVAWRRANLDLFLSLALAVSVAGALVLVLRLANGSADIAAVGRFSVSPEDDPISLGREAANGLLIAVWLALAAETVTARLWAAVSIPVLGISLLAGGSRGPVVGLVVGLMVLLALSVSSRPVRRRLLLVALAVIVTVIAIPEIVPQSAVTRSLSVIAETGGGLSSNGRTLAWSQAWGGFVEHPLIGIGTGGFASIQPLELYPHNLFLEAALELGFIGLVLVTVFLVDVLRRGGAAWLASEGRTRLAVSLTVALFVTAVVNAQFSGGIPNNRGLWLWAGLVTGLAARVLAERRETKT